MNENEEVKCKEHPGAPHGFMRDASHAADRYVCECEHWEPEKYDAYAVAHKAGVYD